MSWIILLVAGLLEVGWAVGLKYTHGFTRPLASALTLAGIGASLWMLAWSTKTIPLGTAYAVWTGIGAAGAAIVGSALFGEPLTLTRVGCLVLLITAIVGLKLTAS